MRVVEAGTAARFEHALKLYQQERGDNLGAGGLSH
jgi:hypothetical protein